MPSYYVFKPGLDITAEVGNAYTSKHARTAFLDYLFRNGKITWGERQNLRRELKTARVDPGQYDVTVKLAYGNPEPIQETEMVAGPSGLEERGLPEEFYPRGLATQSAPPQEVPSEEVPGEIQQTEVPQSVPQAPGWSSPIMDLSRKSTGGTVWVKEQ